MISKYFALLAIIGAATAIEKIPVSIYYETLCEDSMAFFTKQFTPAWKDLSAYMSVTLVPSGKTSSSETGGVRSFICHHGPNECVGNKFQSCVLSSPTLSFSDQVKFIDCLMTKAKIPTDYFQTVDECKADASVDVSSFRSCANGTQGTNLLWSNVQATNKIELPLVSVPTIVFKNMFNREESNRAASSFRSVLCGYIKENPKPDACKGSGAPITTAGLITLVIAGLVIRMI